MANNSILYNWEATCHCHLDSHRNYSVKTHNGYDHICHACAYEHCEICDYCGERYYSTPNLTSDDAISHTLDGNIICGACNKTHKLETEEGIYDRLYDEACREAQESLAMETL